MFSADLGGYTAPLPATDPPFNKVALLLHGDGTNGAQNNAFVDSSTNNFTITRAGNVAQGTFSPFSLPDGQWSNYFGASGTYLGIPSNLTQLQFGTGDFTVECWIYPTNLGSFGGSSQQLIYVGQGASSFCFSVWNNNVHTAKADVADLFDFSSSSVINNRWIHIAITRQSTSLRCFVNGTQVGTTKTDSNNYSGTGSGSIGAYYQGSYKFFGYISNLRIVKGTAVYTSNFTPSTSPLTAVSGTSLLTCQSNRFKDNSSNNFTITRNGDTKVTAFSPFAPSAAYSASTNGGSAYFDGSGDYLSVPSDASLSFGTGDFTVEAWVYFSGSKPTVAKGILDGQSSGSFNFYFDGGTYTSNRLVVSNRLSNQISYSWIPDTETWYHLAVSRSGTSMQLFINGISVTTVTASTSYGSAIYSVGGDAGGGSGWSWNGYISNLRIVKGTALYTANFTPPTAPLTAVANTQLLLNCTNAGIIDNAGKNDIETVGNAQISTSVKKYGTGSMYFDGSGDYLVLPYNQDLEFTGDFTVECWVNVTSKVTSFPTIVNNYSTYTTNGGFAIFASHSSGAAGKFNVSFNGSFPVINSTANVNYGTWQHIALVRSGSTLTLYVDGINNGSATNRSQTVRGTANFWWIGTAGDTLTSGYLNGYIDDLRITKGQALYTANFTPPTQAFPNV